MGLAPEMLAALYEQLDGYVGDGFLSYVDGHDRTAPVGTFPNGASPVGALDMAGNVAEWCRDAYAKDAYKRHRPGERDPVVGPDPKAFAAFRERVLRGGSFCHGSESCRTTGRASFVEQSSFDEIGFRVARSAR